MSKKGIVKKNFRIRVGPEMMEAIKKQMEGIKEVTYDSVDPSIYEACEIIAKKIMGKI